MALAASSTDTPLWVLDGAGWHAGRGRLVLLGEEGYDTALSAYRRRWPRFTPARVQPVVVLRLVGPGIPPARSAFLSVRW